MLMHLIAGSMFGIMHTCNHRCCPTVALPDAIDSEVTLTFPSSSRMGELRGICLGGCDAAFAFARAS